MSQIKGNGIRATSIDVAELAGVSQSTVSRAFSLNSSISEEKRERIFEAARKLNYVPNSIASSLTTQRSNMVAVILGNLDNPFYLEVLKLLSHRLQKNGHQILTFTIENGSNSDDALMRVLRYQVDGVILTSAQLSTRMANICHNRGIPISLFNRYIPGANASCVRCDNLGGGRMIAEAFLNAGARTFAVIKGDSYGTTSQDRVRGFIACLLEAGVTRSSIVELDGYSVYEGGKTAILKAFYDENFIVPDAIFGVNDAMAMGAIDALRGNLGLRVPEDVMVGGFDNIPEAARWPYRLTTVRQPIDEMITETLAILQLGPPGQLVNSNTDRIFPGELIWRDTIPEVKFG